MKTYIGTKIIRAERKDRPGESPSQIEGYKVIYQDGYASWSPKDTFEEAYREVHGLDFGDAIRALKAGKRVARAGWNGKGMWLSLSEPLEGRKISHDKFWSLNNATFAYDQPNNQANVLPCITMKTADESILMGWLASQSDMLAEDWVVLS